MADKTNKTILFVDDEKQILKALKRLFLRSENRILLAEGGKQALEVLATEKVDMMITDMRMPEMDGHELLVEVKKRYPEIIRIALSGYTDKKVVLSALDKNLAKIYLFKPWNNDEIKQIIDGLFAFEGMLKDKNLLNIINNLDNLPTIPHLYHRITEMVEAENSIEEITACIEEDQAIASRILRIANSAYYGSKTGSIKDAVMFIGLDNIKSIILTNAVYSSTSGNQKELERIWSHSSKTNKILHLIYTKLLKKRLSRDEKSAGLLHNIGEGIILTNIGHLDEELLASIKEMGIGHEHIGGYLMNWWELTLPIIESALFHHQPENPMIVNKELVCAVHLAQAMAWQSMEDKEAGSISMKALEILGISQKDLENLIDRDL